MSSTQIDSTKVQKAREWCNRARELLGGGYYLISSLDSVEMHRRIEEVASGLTSLETTNPTAYQRLGNDFRRVSKSAKAAVSSNDQDASRRVSQELEILRLEILAESSGPSTEIQRKLFEHRMKFAQLELVRLQAIADTDLHRLQKTRVESIQSQAYKSTDFTTGAAQLLVATQEIQKEIENWTQKQQEWLNANPKRVQILDIAQKLHKDSPYRPKITELIQAADDLALRVRDYSTAQQFVDRSSTIAREAVEYEAPIRKKIEAFLLADKDLVLLCDQVKVLLDRLVQAVQSKQQQQKGAVVAQGAYLAMGQAGKDYAECVRLATEYRNRAQKGILEAWGSYPEAINDAIKKLKTAKQQLEQIFSSKKNTDNTVNGIILKHEEQIRKEQLLKAWLEARSEAEKELDKLAESLGPTHETFRQQNSQFQLLLNTYNGLTVEYDPAKLKQFIQVVKQLVDRFQKQREALQIQRNQVRDKWNELFEKRSIFPKSYYDGISDEYDQFKIYLDSPNLAVVEMGLQKRRELLDRFEKAIASPEKIREGGATYERIAQLLKKNQADLASYQPSRHAEYRFTLEELAKVVHTEDPSTLLPKLNNLELAIKDCLLKAAEIKKFRQELDLLANELTKLYSTLLQAYSRLGKQIPKDYQSSFEKVGAQHLVSARSLEDLVLAQGHRKRLEELKSKLEDLLKSDLLVAQQFDTAESKQVNIENERRNGLEQQRLTYEFEWNQFQNGLYKELKSKLGRSTLSIFLGQGVDQIQAVDRTLDRAKTFAKKEDHASALSELRVAVQAARTLISQVVPSKLNDSLAGLPVPYRKAIQGVQQAATDVIGEIRKITDKIVSQNTKADSTELMKRVQRLSELLKGISGDEFDGLIDVLRDPNRSDRKEKAEQGLQIVRQQIKFVTSDPLLRLLTRNPFKIKVPHFDLLRALQNLELALQTAK